MSRTEAPSLLMPLLLLWAGVFAVFTPSLSGEFLLDDSHYVAANPALRSAPWTRFLTDPATLTVEPTQSSTMYRPLTAASFALTARLTDGSPFWYHLASVALHATNACLLALFCLSLLRGRDSPGSSRSLRAACLTGALLFALHPAQAESVAYISGSRATVLSLFFCLLAALLYAREPKARGGSAAAFILGLLCKEGAAFLLPVLPAIDWTLGRRSSRRLPGWTPHAACFAVYLAVRHLALGGAWAHRGLWGGSLASHLASTAHGLFQDVLIALWPTSLRICYSFPHGPGFFPVAAAKGALLLGLCAAAALALRRRHPAGLALLWFLAGLLPVANIVPLQLLAADRFLYAPLAGLAFLAAWALSRAPARAAVTAAAVLALFLGLRCSAGLLSWQNGFVLDLDARDAAPSDPCTGVQLSAHYLNWRMYERADESLAPALEERAAPHLRQGARVQRGLILAKAGRSDEAVPYLEEAVLLRPGDPFLEDLLLSCRSRAASHK